MFDISSIPKITIRDGILNDTQIVKDSHFYQLLINNEQWMKVNTKGDLELREFYSSYDLAYGNVLLSGFGFGILPLWISTKPNVNKVTVVEFNKNVVDLFLRFNNLDHKINIEIYDIHNFKSQDKYDWLILDHYEGNKKPTKEELSLLTKNLEFQNLWFWSLEYLLTECTSWQEFREKYSFKIPDLPKEQVLRYMENLFRHRDFHL